MLVREKRRRLGITDEPEGATAMIVYGPHAADMLAERGIDPLWVERTVLYPETVEADPKHVARTRVFSAIPERDGRVLRVVYERVEDTVRIITVFLDRNRRRRE